MTLVRKDPCGARNKTMCKWTWQVALPAAIALSFLVGGCREDKTKAKPPRIKPGMSELERTRAELAQCKDLLSRSQQEKLEFASQAQKARGEAATYTQKLAQLTEERDAAIEKANRARAKAADLEERVAMLAGQQGLTPNDVNRLATVQDAKKKRLERATGAARKKTSSAKKPALAP
jgi:predicted  nucleic acid-binding Zn-ribbon protein